MVRSTVHGFKDGGWVASVWSNSFWRWIRRKPHRKMWRETFTCERDANEAAARTVKDWKNK